MGVYILCATLGWAAICLLVWWLFFRNVSFVDDDRTY